MTYATFIPTDAHVGTVSGPIADVVDYVRHRFPDAITHGTSVNDGVVEFGKLVAHDVNGEIRQRDPFTGTMMSAGNIRDRLYAAATR